MQGEQVVGVVPMARTKTGMFSSKTYTLVFTNARLILAEARSDLVKAEVERSRTAAKEAGSGLLGQWGAQLKAGNRFGLHYMGVDPDAILAETPGNVAVPPQEVRQLKVDRKTRNAGSDDDFEQVFLRITLETAAGKRSYDTDAEQPKLDDARAMVAWFLGPR